MSYTAISDDTYHLVYKSRYEISRHRQSHFASELQTFNQFLTDLKRMHPYSRDSQLYSMCKTINSFVNGDQAWIPAEPKHSTLYRIANLKKMFLPNDDFTISIRDDAPRLKTIRTEVDIPLVFNQLQYSVRHSSNRWLRLSDYLNLYEPTRGFTWWTTFPLEEAQSAVDLLSKVHRLGIPSDWVGEYSVIMKLELPTEQEALQRNNAPTVWVPSVIDACFSSIFKAQPQHTNPKTGVAINLKEPNQTGEDEFVVRGDTLTNVQFRPMQVNKDAWHDRSVDYGKISENLYHTIISYH